MASKDETRLVLIGKTGSGKSTTGNTILGGGNNFKSKVGSKSVTKVCSYAHGFNLGKRISIVDTPGLYDTDMSKDEVNREIVKCVGISSPGPHAIIFVTRIGRFTNEERKTIQHFVDHFGEGMYKYLIVIFTGGDDLIHDATTLAEYVADSPPALKEILHLAGNRYIAFNNRASDPDVQVQALLSIVADTVSVNGGSCYTNAMYEKAEAVLKEKEEKKRLEAEAKKQEEVDRIKAECREDMQQELERIERKHKADMEEMREENRKEITKIGPLQSVGKALDEKCVLS